MPSCAGRYRDQPVRTLFHGLAGETVIDDVMHDHAAPAMDSRIDLGNGAKRGDDQRHLVPFQHFEVLFEPVVALVDDEVDRKGCVITLCFFTDLIKPIVELAGGTGIERRKAADDARTNLRHDQFGRRNDEHGSGNHGKAQAVEGRGQGHVQSV